jgi:FkbM family methyltransferase
MTTLTSYTVAAGNVSAQLLADDRIVSRILDKGQEYEPKSLRYWVSKCKPGMTAVDVGAYSGLYSILAAKCGCDVMSFEPMEEMRKVLNSNLKLNGVTAKLFHAAVSDHVGEQTLYFDQAVNRTAGATFHPNKAQKWKVVVPTVTLDSMALENVCAIKLDAERHEEQILKGGLELLHKCKPALLLEVLSDKLRKEVIAAVSPLYRFVGNLDTRNIAMEAV